MINDLNSLGWKAFQDLCAAIASEILGRPVQLFLPSRDGGRDGAFVGTWEGAPKDDQTAKSTIQCKFIGKPDATLTLAQMNPELSKVQRLAKCGLAHDYIIMTSAGISGEADAAISAAFEAAGAERCRVFGRDWITDQLRQRPRLRMMVPRVYGIGDLSQILDDRAYVQARYILSAIGDDLRCFVTTAAHRNGVEALTTRGFVLLLGDPASGKSTIAATLALGALDAGSTGAVRITSPDQMERWNPHEKQLLWVDDAFGSNQFDAARTDAWNAQLPLLRAAVKNGCRIVFTSRNYIWEAARRQLRTGHFPLLTESQVIIDVQSLSETERAQILYNHIKLGEQPRAIRRALKPLLPAVAANPAFLPETARRLGSPMFTKGLRFTECSLEDFVERPVDFLKEVLEKLDEPGKAAIALIFLHGANGVSSPVQPGWALNTVSRLMGVPPAAITRSLELFNGSLTLLVERPEGCRWIFRHPTVTDAFSALVAESPELVELYIRGTKIETLLAEVVCGPMKIQGAKVRVPRALYPAFLVRLRAHPLDSRLQRFLSTRCDKKMLASYVAACPQVFDLANRVIPDLAFNADTSLLAQLNRTGLLPEPVRIPLVERIADLTLNYMDASVFCDDDLRSLFAGAEFSELAAKFKAEVIDDLPGTVWRWGSQYITDDEIGHFEFLRDNLSRAAQYFAKDKSTKAAFAAAERQIIEHVAQLEPPNPRSPPSSLQSPLRSSNATKLASIFDDVDDM